MTEPRYPEIAVRLPRGCCNRFSLHRRVDVAVADSGLTEEKRRRISDEFFDEAGDQNACGFRRVARRYFTITTGGESR